MPSLFTTVAYNAPKTLSTTTFRAVVDMTQAAIAFTTQPPYFDDPNATTTAAPPSPPASDDGFDWMKFGLIFGGAVIGVCILAGAWRQCSKARSGYNALGHHNGEDETACQTCMFA